MTAANWIAIGVSIFSIALIPTGLWMVRVAIDLRELRVRLDHFLARVAELDREQEELAAGHKELSLRVDRHEVRISKLEINS